MNDYSYKTLRKRKVVLLGSFGVGKTSLINRFVHNSFTHNYHTTIGVNVQTKLVLHNKTQYSLILWDIAGGQHKYAVPFSYLLMSAGAIYVYDVTRLPSYENIRIELKAISSKIKSAPIIVVGNKIDLLSKEELAAHKLFMRDVTHLYTSAKENIEVEDAFRLLIEKMATVKL